VSTGPRRASLARAPTRRWRSAACRRARRAPPWPRTCSTPTRRASDVRRGIEQKLPARQAEAAAQAAGYFAILAPRYAQDRGAAAEERASAIFADLPASLDAAEAALEGFTAAPFTPEEAARRAQQLLQFLALVPVEYGRGVKGTQVTRDFEIQESVAFRTGAVAAFATRPAPARPLTR
jgi:hypothetical protein